MSLGKQFSADLGEPDGDMLHMANTIRNASVLLVAAAGNGALLSHALSVAAARPAKALTRLWGWARGGAIHHGGVAHGRCFPHDGSMRVTPSSSLLPLGRADNTNMNQPNFDTKALWYFPAALAHPRWGYDNIIAGGVWGVWG